MKACLTWLTVTWIVFAFAAGASCADQADTKPQPDPRLSQPVTIQCVNVRLHMALQKIAEEAGITLWCGKDGKDWRVRDLPVVVSAKDVPLGRLLRAVADATHLLFSDTVAEDGRHIYRISRDTRRVKDLAGYYAAFETAELARAAYDWDLWTKVKDLPDSAFKPSRTGPEWTQRRNAEHKMISELMAALGSDAKDRIMAGEVVKMGVKTGPEPLRDKLADFFNSSWRATYHNGAMSSRMTSDEMTDRELDRSVLIFSYMYSRSLGDRSKDLQITGMIGDEYHSHGYGLHYDAETLQSSLNQEEAKLPPRPSIPNPPVYGETARQYALLDLHKGGTVPLTDKIELPAWKEKRSPTYADVLVAVANATGLAIVAEDFDSHLVGSMLSRANQVPAFFGRKVTVAEVLRFASGSRWRLDSERKLIIGSDRHWPEQVRNLVPASVIEVLTAKLNGLGVEFADLEPIAKFEGDQSCAWITNHPGLDRLEHPTFCVRQGSIWKVYFALSAADRNAASGSTGASLIRLDPQWLAEMFRQRRRDLSGLISVGNPTAEIRTAQDDALSDPDTMPPLRLTLAKVEYPKLGPGKHGYRITITGQKEGQPIRFVDELGPFPIYSAEREAELAKTDQKQPKPTRH